MPELATPLPPVATARAILRVGAALLVVSTALSQSHRTNGERSIAEIVRATSPAVVLVVASNPSGESVTQGSGFIISPDGKVVTNYHVIQGAKSALIKLSNGAFFPVDGIIAASEGDDVVVIKVSGRNLPSLSLREADNLAPGDKVIAIGSPLGLEGTVTDGIVSAIREDEAGTPLIQTTAPASHGNSGGPLVDLHGRVVGILTFKWKGGENLNFAVSVKALKPLLASGHTPRPLSVEGGSHAGVPAEPPPPAPGTRPVELNPKPAEVGGNVRGPVAICKPEPAYSEEARKAKLQGTVVLWIVVGPDGNVSDVRVVKPLGLGLDEQAVETVRTWKFRPCMRLGNPVPCYVSVEVGFHIPQTPDTQGASGAPAQYQRPAGCQIAFVTVWFDWGHLYDQEWTRWGWMTEGQRMWWNGKGYKKFSRLCMVADGSQADFVIAVSNHPTTYTYDATAIVMGRDRTHILKRFDRNYSNQDQRVLEEALKFISR